MLKRCIVLLAIAALGLVGCDGGPTGPQDGARVSIQFRTVSSAQGSLSAVSASLASNANGSLTITGTNGTLVIDDVWLIMAEFELELADGECDDLIDEDDCEELELSPQFLQLPLQDGVVTAVSQEVPAGVYAEFEFEVEDVEVDDDEDEENAEQLTQLFLAIQTTFPDWPEEASMLVVGSFTPTAGARVDFRVFFEAEIEIEMEFEPPLVILEADTDKIVTVTVDPSAWFLRPDGTVLDLSQFEGQLVEFEVEMEDGFTEIEFDD